LKNVAPKRIVGWRHNRDPSPAAFPPHATDDHLHIADIHLTRLTFGIPIDGLACLGGHRGSITGRVLVDLQVRIHYQRASMCGLGLTGKPDNRNKLCLLARLFPRPRPCPEFGEVPTPGGLASRFATFACVGPRATLKPFSNPGNWTQHGANRRKRGVSPMDWAAIVSPVAWYAIRVLEFIEYIERFSAKPRMIGRVCWHHARTCLPNRGDQMQIVANRCECGVKWGKTNRLGDNNFARGSGSSSLWNI
jgi:hypothetical protein